MNSFKNRFIAATPMICLIAFLLLGFLADAWHPGWVVFLAIPIVPSILNKSLSRLLYPSLCVLAFFVLGLVFGLWHPGWIVFLTIPVFYILFPERKREN